MLSPWIQRHGLKLGLFAFVYVVCMASPVTTSYDSYWNVPVALNVLEHGKVRLDAYRFLFNERTAYSTECVDLDRSPSEFAARADACKESRLLPKYPLGVPLLSLPLIAPAAALYRLRGVDPLSHTLGLERHAAAMWIAMSAVLVFSIAGMYLSYRKSVVLALLFVFGTSVYSTGALALWQHTPSVFLIACAIYLLLLAERTPAMVAWCALPLALSYTVRPSDAVLVAVCTVYVWVHHRSQVLRFAMIGGAVTAAFFLMNFSQYGSVLPAYYRARTEMGAPGYWSGVGIAAAGLLVSPSRGLFVFTPVFLVAVLNMARLRWNTRFAPWLSVAVAASFFATLLYLGPRSWPGVWWGGFSYGPRLLTDYAPILTLFLIPVFEQWGTLGRSLRIGFVTLALAGVLIHVRAGWNAHLISWNWTPISVDVDQARLWDWSDPQFLR